MEDDCVVGCTAQDRKVEVGLHGIVRNSDRDTDLDARIFRLHLFVKGPLVLCIAGARIRFRMKIGFAACREDFVSYLEIFNAVFLDVVCVLNQAGAIGDGIATSIAIRGIRSVIDGVDHVQAERLGYLLHIGVNVIAGISKVLHGAHDCFLLCADIAALPVMQVGADSAVAATVADRSDTRSLEAGDKGVRPRWCGDVLVEVSVTKNIFVYGAERFMGNIDAPAWHLRNRRSVVFSDLRSVPGMIGKEDFGKGHLLAGVRGPREEPVPEQA